MVDGFPDRGFFDTAASCPYAAASAIVRVSNLEPKTDVRGAIVNGHDGT